MDKEFILCAALNFNGSIICGHRHSDCYKTLMDVVKVKDEDLPCEIIKLSNLFK
jgi:hypothetical protein